MEHFQTIDILIFLAYVLVFLCIVTNLTSTILGVFFFLFFMQQQTLFSLKASESITSTRRGSFFWGVFYRHKEKKTHNGLDVLVYLHSKVDWLLIKTLFKSPFFSVRICEDKRDMFSVVTWWRMAGRFLLTIPQISSLWILLCLLILGVFWWMDGWTVDTWLHSLCTLFLSSG